MTQMSGTMIAAIRSVPLKDWSDLFDSLVRDREVTLSGTPDEELPALKAKVLETKAIKEFFLREWQR